MFQKNVDERLSDWATFRKHVNDSQTPFLDVWGFWKNAPYIPYNNKVDPFNQKSWPTPWDIIVYNKYDDFTKALMIGWTLRLTERFKNSIIEIKTIVNDQKTCYYNVVCVDNTTAINYGDNGPITLEELPTSFFLENLIELSGSW